jgi:hypothetical protein
MERARASPVHRTPRNMMKEGDHGSFLFCLCNS